MRIVYAVTGLTFTTLALSGGIAYATNEVGLPAKKVNAKPLLTAKGRTSTAAPSKGLMVSRIRVIGVTNHADLGITPATMQALADAELSKLSASAIGPVNLSYEQLQAVADKVTEAYAGTGRIAARAFIAAQTTGGDHTAELCVLEGDTGRVAVKSLLPSVPDLPATTSPPPVIIAESADLASSVPAEKDADVPLPVVSQAASPPAVPVAPGPAAVVPPLKDRAASNSQTQGLVVSHIRVSGVADHAKRGITPAAMQALANAEYAKLAAASGSPARLSYPQLQAVADKITEAYKSSGFIVSRAFLPVQTVGDDNVVELRVLEGVIGKIIVKGAKRYNPDVIAATAEPLKGKPLLKSEVDSALLYARDLPGATVSATFQPGENTGETDLVLIANEAPRPYSFTVGANNFGTEFTGRYRAQAGFTLDSPLGIGDQLAAKLEYAIDPTNNVYGSVLYRMPAVTVPGLTGVIGFARNELQINTGRFAVAEIKGPTKVYQGGLEWKFINDVDLKAQTSLLYVYEKSKLSIIGTQLANEQFSVAALKLSANHTDRALHGVDLLEAGVRQSINEFSDTRDDVSPNHAGEFFISSLSYTRIQFLSPTQRFYGKFNGQFTDKELIPLEQFLLGGPDSVRAYPIADELRDRGYFTSLEYHIDAPGFGDVISPFYSRPWKELFELETFADYAQGFSVGKNRSGPSPDSVELSGVGLGFIFRVPKFYQLQFHLQGAVPLSAKNASNGDDYHIYGQVNLTF